MEVRYGNDRVRKLATDKKRACRDLGAQQADGLAKRIKQLESAETLRDIFPPATGRWHWLNQNWAGHASGTVKNALRIIVWPENGELNPPLDATTVTVVEISEHYEKGR